MLVNIAGNEIDLDLEDGDLVLDCIVLARIARADDSGISGLLIGTTDTTDDIVVNGMIRRAVQIIESDVITLMLGDDEE
jgi:hypothetical protein